MDWVKDLRFGARLLVRKPAFTAVAALTLALGGLSTTLLSRTAEGAAQGLAKMRAQAQLLAANGLVNLADQSLNMHVTAVLNKALSQQVGGTQVGGLMNTALANNAGELVIPIILTGNFQHPQVAPDVQAIAQMKLQNLLPTSKNPGALTSRMSTVNLLATISWRT